jgi:hypothetical protein
MQKDFGNEKERLLTIINEKGKENLLNKSKISELETQILENSIMQMKSTTPPLEQLKRADKSHPSSPIHNSSFYIPSLPHPPSTSVHASNTNPPRPLNLKSHNTLPPISPIDPSHMSPLNPTSSLPNFFNPITHSPLNPITLSMDPLTINMELKSMNPPFLNRTSSEIQNSFRNPSFSELEELRLKIEMKERENKKIEERMNDLMAEIEEWRRRYENIEEKLRMKN